MHGSVDLIGADVVSQRRLWLPGRPVSIRLSGGPTSLRWTVHRLSSLPLPGRSAGIGLPRRLTPLVGTVHSCSSGTSVCGDSLSRYVALPAATWFC